MTTPADYRAALAKLLQAIKDDVIECNDGKRFQALVEDARALLAAPEAVGVADEELLFHVGEYADECIMETPSERKAFTEALRAMIARYGTARPAPVPLGERLPGVADLDAEGKCWWYSQRFSTWCRESPPVARVRGIGRFFWLPHWALPLPRPQP